MKRTIATALTIAALSALILAGCGQPPGSGAGQGSLTLNIKLSAISTPTFANEIMKPIGKGAARLVPSNTAEIDIWLISATHTIIKQIFPTNLASVTETLNYIPEGTYKVQAFALDSTNTASSFVWAAGQASSVEVVAAESKPVSLHMQALSFAVTQDPTGPLVTGQQSDLQGNLTLPFDLAAAAIADMYASFEDRDHISNVFVTADRTSPLYSFTAGINNTFSFTFQAPALNTSPAIYDCLAIGLHWQMMDDLDNTYLYRGIYMAGWTDPNLATPPTYETAASLSHVHVSSP